MTMNIDVAGPTDAVGTTANTPEAIGTVTLNSKARRVIGFIFQAVGSGTKTPTEATLGTFVVTSADLDLVDYEITSLNAFGAPPATNSEADMPFPQIVPVMKSGDFDGSSISFQYNAELPEPTEDMAAQAFVIYDDGTTPQRVIDRLFSGYGAMNYPVNQSKSSNLPTAGSATSAALTDTINIEGKFTTVNNYVCVIVPDAAETDSEPLLGYIEWTSSYTGITPLKTPIPALGSELGTKVGKATNPKPIVLPLWVPKGTKKEQFTPTLKLLGTTSGAFAINVSLTAE